MSNKIYIRGPGFLTCLALLFIGLKLTNYIDWSWFWVLFPLWMPFAIVFSLGIVIIIFSMSIFLIGIFMYCLGILFEHFSDNELRWKNKIKGYYLILKSKLKK